MSHRGPHPAILGGINGARKTTTAERLAVRPPYAGAVFLNPDKIAARAGAVTLPGRDALPEATRVLAPLARR